jgi:uncharacterized protein (TIGR03545 family)
LKDKLSLPTIDKGSMARAIFGPAVAKWGERLLNGVHTVRQHMPPKPAAPPPPPRGRARIIEFPRHNALPRFLLVKAQLSGEVGKENPFGFSGILTGITTNPPLYGKPATVNLHGNQGARSFNVQGVLDHTHDIPSESLQASYAGFSLNNLNLGQDGGLGMALRQGQGKANVALSIRGEQLEGHATMEGTGLSVEPKVDLKSDNAIAQRAAKNVTASLSQVKAMSVGIGIGGTLASPQLNIESNIGSIISDALKNALGAEVAEQEKALRAELEKQTAGKIQELQGSVDALKQKALPQLAGHTQVIDDLLGQVKSQAGRAIPGGNKPIEGLKNIFKR